MDLILHQLNATTLDFPPVDQALVQPNGLLAFGGVLDTRTLLKAYQDGIFPWFNKGEPILWWSPDPRMVIDPTLIHISRSMKKLLRSNPYLITIDKHFSAVIHQCKVQREQAEGTWITDSMEQAYNDLHQQGYAHSVEIWESDHLVGGIYGIAWINSFLVNPCLVEKPTRPNWLLYIFASFWPNRASNGLTAKCPILIWNP